MKDYEPNELKAIKDNDNVILLDVREPWEYEEDNLTEHNIPLHDIPGRMDELQEWKDKEIVCYCNTGQNSEMACNVLEEAGFEHISHLNGGIEAWHEQFGK